MGETQTGDEITEFWHKEATWFDFQFYKKKRIENCRDEFRQQFAKIKNVQTGFLEIEAYVDGNVGFVQSIQHFQCENENGSPSASFLTRQTDGYIRENGKWRLIHQQLSLPTYFRTDHSLFKTEF
ncbi:nuclear transport factor 2 family protein [Paenibacillus sp. N3/727]|uniref:YybH family protein n=1 Tax=Paenibacillus sp. N3/727 TaxID=2925845 RepID=UPI001F53E076|nr:nuclear transport factor 2 family protein [Paenibacillus sp. N3/727]UNK20998.1 nuclear transport factor 2 family protein [Paenibacillus sp. N3/727]